MIELRYVTKNRKGFDLKIDHLDLQPGMTLVVGRNGAGKSTLLHMLATGLTPSAGTITFAGLPLEQLQRIRREIGFLPTGIELFEDMTSEKFLAYMARMKGISQPEPDIHRVMDALHLQGVRKKKIGRLSEGYQQRVAAAQALLGFPYFLFLDEPLTGLDSYEKNVLVKWIGTHYTDKRQAVIISHELNEWEAVCDHVLWIDNGRVAFYGTAVQWKYVTGAGVWEGELPFEQTPSFSEDDVLMRRQTDNGVSFRIMSDDPPGPGFQPCALTLEDAYFLRRRALAHRFS